MSKKFKKGDNVIVIAGIDKKKQGKIVSIKKDKVVVEKINIATVHKKPTSSEAGSIIKIEKPLHISNISHAENDAPVRVGFVVEPINGKKPFASKARISRKTSKKI